MLFPCTKYKVCTLNLNYDGFDDLFQSTSINVFCSVSGIGQNVIKQKRESQQHKNSVPSLLSASSQMTPKSSGKSQNSSAIIDVAIADEDTEEDESLNIQDQTGINPNNSENSRETNAVNSATRSGLKKEYKMIRLIKADDQSNELGIIIAKKKLPDLQPPVTGFQVVHIEPRGLIDRYVFNSQKLSKTAKN